ncbi:hypothetical protein DUI87_14904 [Hirundo rustica rustica]|uniref:Uncharacterized protein n=1 Tax=Hirundo rustica rustica TaxID=333673 RepID=A0A3M0K642_HIRRU|nr:hypothetical protein DUI87_14904 [Hirundo rustica rustica]
MPGSADFHLAEVAELVFSGAFSFTVKQLAKEIEKLDGLDGMDFSHLNKDQINQFCKFSPAGVTVVSCSPELCAVPHKALKIEAVLSEQDSLSFDWTQTEKEREKQAWEKPRYAKYLQLPVSSLLFTIYEQVMTETMYALLLGRNANVILFWYEEEKQDDKKVWARFVLYMSEQLKHTSENVKSQNLRIPLAAKGEGTSKSHLQETATKLLSFLLEMLSSG